MSTTFRRSAEALLLLFMFISYDKPVPVETDEIYNYSTHRKLRTRGFADLFIPEYLGDRRRNRRMIKSM